jgi:hypothetical protein
MRQTNLGILAVTAVFLGGAIAAEAQGTTAARSQLRRTVEDSERSAFGAVSLKETPTKQTFDTVLSKLAQESFRVYITTNESSGFSTNDFVFSVAPLDRKSIKGGKWLRKLKGIGQAPDAVLPYFTDLSSLGGRQVVIARPGPDTLVSLTNVFGCVTNILSGSTNVVCSTNIIVGVPLFDPAVTGTVSAVMWAPIPGFLSKLGISNTNQRVALGLPGGVPPSPAAKGEIRTRFNNAQGQSVLEIRATGLTRGQVYSVWIGDSATPSVLVKAGDVVAKQDGAKVSFIRDTKRGDPLPQQVSFLGDLSGRPIAILDEFESPHLVGTLP